MSNEDDEESCLTRQFNEAAVLKSIYGDQLALLSELHQPLECIIHLWGHDSSDDDPRNVPRFDLHIKCCEDYPLVIPSIQLENYKKIANNCIGTLRSELLNLANTFKGEVLIHELAQHCENFLFHYDSPKSISLYEGMMKRNKDIEETRAKELQKRLEDEQRKKEEMIGHIQSQKQAVKKALRRKSKSENAEQEEQGYRERSSSSSDETRTPQRQFGPRVGPRHFEPVSEFSSWDVITKSPGPSRFLNDFQVIEELGRGAYGEVVKVRNIFDERCYAIKKIELDPKMTRTRIQIDREVKLLSRLDHENVVRYFGSWVERVHVDKSESLDTLDSSSHKGLNQDVMEMLPCDQEAIDWNVEPKRGQDDDSDDFIQFVSETSEPVESESSSDTSGKSSQTLKPLLYVYIQMELCEKSTLRIAIDKGLYRDVDRAWRLFREIVEGVNYIHHQRVMHRDLKPVNIFLHNNDQVKIGDFGLATTSKAQKSNVNVIANPSVTTVDTSFTSDSSLKECSTTGPIGTALYVAPELDEDNRRPECNLKVDIYSLGIIFFEMVHEPFNTFMERYHALTYLRTPEIMFPPDSPYSEKSNERKIITWMLTHDIKARPSAQSLLSHEFLLTVKLDEGEVRDMVKRTLSNPQSKDYKFLIASCFNQEMPATFEATYNMSTFRSFRSISSLNLVVELLKPIFHHYGAVSFSPPLFTPGQAPSNGVTLMTRVGGVVHVTCDLQMPFARYVVQNPSVMTFKRYAVDKSFKEMPVGIHPREVYECSFDIVSSSWGDLMPEIEVFAVVKDILKAFPQLLGRNCTIYLNHSTLISTLIDICVANSSTAADKTETRDAIIKAMTETSPKVDLKSFPLSESALSVISSWAEIEGDAKSIIGSLNDLVRAEELQAECQRAVDQLQKVIAECSALAMPCPVVIKPSLMRNPNHFTGVLFQVKCEAKGKAKNWEPCIVMSGGRYDGLLEELRLQIPSKDVSKPVRCITGFTMNLENLVSSIDDEGGPSAADVLLCSLGSFKRTPDRTSLLRELWGLNLRIYFSTTLQTMEEIQSLCDQLGVTVLLLFKANEPGSVRVRSLNKESKSNEKKMNSCDVVEYLSKLFKQEATVSSSRPAVNVPIIHFISTEKITLGSMKIHETQVNENLATVIQRLSPSVRVDVLALQVKEREFIKVISSLIELEDVAKSLDQACKRYPSYRKLIQKLSKQIEDLKTSHPTSVIILYSLYDNGFRVIM